MKEYFRRQRIYYRYHRWARLWPVIMVLLVILSGYFQAFAVLLCATVTLGLSTVCAEAENALPRTQEEVRSERLARLRAIFLEQLVLGLIAYALHYAYVRAVTAQRIGWSAFADRYVVHDSVLTARPWFMAMFFVLVMLVLYDWLLYADGAQPAKTLDVSENGRLRVRMRRVTSRSIAEGICEHFPRLLIFFITGVLWLGRDVFLEKSPVAPAILVGAAIVCKGVRVVLRRRAYQPEDFETRNAGIV